jgi:hypothetical protein
MVLFPDPFPSAALTFPIEEVVVARPLAVSELEADVRSKVVLRRLDVVLIAVAVMAVSR